MKKAIIALSLIPLLAIPLSGCAKKDSALAKACGTLSVLSKNEEMANSLTDIAPFIYDLAGDYDSLSGTAINTMAAKSIKQALDTYSESVTNPGAYRQDFRGKVAAGLFNCKKRV